MNAAAFRIVIIGAGAVSRAAHVPAVLASPLAALVAVIDPDVERARTLCRDFGVKADVAATIEQLSCSFDGAIIAAPNDLHAPLAMALVGNNVPVLVEKPVATNVAAARELAALADARHVVVCVGYHTRHSGACRVLKHAVTTEHFGRVVRFAHQDGSRGGWSPLSGYNLDVRRAGGGVLVTTGTHFLDRLLWLWGTPDEVSLHDNAMGGPESHCIARFLFRHDDQEVSGVAIFSKEVALPESTVVQTTEGLLIMPSDAAQSITFHPLRDAHLEYEVHLPDWRIDPRSLYQRELEDFIAACRGGTRPCVDATAGAQSVELLARLYASRQPLADTPNAPTAERANA